MTRRDNDIHKRASEVKANEMKGGSANSEIETKREGREIKKKGSL